MAHTIQFFKLIRELSQKMGIHPCQQNEKPAYNLRNSFILICLTGIFVECVTCLLFKARSIEEYGLSFFSSTALLLPLVLWPCFIHNKGDLFNLMDEMDEFGQKRDGSVLKSMHDKMNERIERVTKWTYKYYCKIFLALTLSIVFIGSFYRYYIADLGEDAFYSAAPVMLPFNWKTPLGYTIALFVIGLTEFFLRIVFSLIFCFYIGFCWLIISFMKDITNDLEMLTRNDGQKDQEIAETFSEIVDLYSTVKHMIVKFNQIYEYVPTGIILCSLSTICVVLLISEIQLGNAGNSMNILIDIFNTTALTTNLFAATFLFLEFGQMVNNEFDTFDEKLCECVWYTFPLKTQHFFRAFMMYSQDPVFIQGFGNTECTREMFQRVIRASWSYFMVLHQFK